MPSVQETFIARVTQSHGRHAFVTTSDGKTYEAHRRGKKGDVVVGDFVRCTSPIADCVRIESIEPRHSLLYRSDQWRVKELASNIDQIFILFASEPTFNPWFIWKSLLASHQANITPYVIRTKTDIEETNHTARDFLLSLNSIGEKTLEISVKENPTEVKKELISILAGKTTLMVGQSGMGKSTLLNLMVPEACAPTREISIALDLGKQTTTSTTLYKVQTENKIGYLIDSPGFQEFGLAHLSSLDILRAMPDIARQVDGCRFYNCTHTKEPGCSVLKALAENKIDAKRHAFYVEMITHAGR